MLKHGVIIDKRIMENEINKWIRVQKHSVLKHGVITIEDRQINVIALFENRDSTIMVCNDEESEYAFKRVNDKSDWEPIKYIPKEILNELGGGPIIDNFFRI